jgi:hypothetical protein
MRGAKFKFPFSLISLYPILTIKISLNSLMLTASKAKGKNRGRVSGAGAGQKHVFTGTRHPAPFFLLPFARDTLY